MALASLTAFAAAAEPGAGCASARESTQESIAHCSRDIESAVLGAAQKSASHTRRGLDWMALGKLERAAADFDEAIRLDERSSWAWNARAVARMQKGEVDAAFADFDRAIELKPDYAFAITNRGNAWLAKGHADRALADLERAVQLDPPQVELALTGRGRAWLAKGDFARALGDFNDALKANPRYANAVSGRAYARFCLGDFEGAAIGFGEERQFRPDAESSTAWIIALRRAGHSARRELEDAVHGSDPTQGYPGGLGLFLGKLTPQQVLEATRDREPHQQRRRQCEAEFQVGEWYLILGQPDQARTYLGAARATCDMGEPQFAAAGSELARLAAQTLSTTEGVTR